MANYRRVARQKAKKYGLDANVFGRQIQQESGYNPGARSSAGAQGIAQIMPGTAQGWHVDPNNPVAALDAAAKHMAQYVKQYGSYENALVAYNAGPGAVGGKLPAETQAYIKNILGGTTPKVSGNIGAGAPTYGTPPVGTDKRALALSLLGMGGYGGGDPLTLALQQQTQKQTVRPSVPQGPQPTGSDIAAVVSRAKAIDSEKLPYQWGGGHGSTPSGPGVPVDCSGAVSRLLNVSPRVSGDFAKFGQPGPGQKLTIYANGKHVLMEINGHFWGTSASNPGGGAGWIPRSQIGPGYLKGFSVRHPPGM